MQKLKNSSTINNNCHCPKNNDRESTPTFFTSLYKLFLCYVIREIFLIKKFDE